MNGFLKDIQFALRQLYARPAFTAVAVIVLALGLGATAAIFSVAHAVLLQPLPYPNPKTLVGVFESDVVGNAPDDAFNVVSPGLFQEWQKDARPLSAMAAVWEFRSTSRARADHSYRNTPTGSRALPHFWNFSMYDRFSAVFSIAAKTNLKPVRSGSFVWVPAKNVSAEPVTLRASKFAWTEAITRLWACFRRILSIQDSRPMYLCRSSEPWTSTIGPPSAIIFSMSLAVLAPGYSIAAADQELKAIVLNIRRTHPKEIMGSFATVAAFNGYLVRDYRTALLVLQGAVGDENDFCAIVRTDRDPTALTRSIRRILRNLDPDLPMRNVRTFAQINAESIADRRFSASVLVLFAIAALMLVSYNVTQSMAEIGIRMALVPSTWRSAASCWSMG